MSLIKQIFKPKKSDSKPAKTKKVVEAVEVAEEKVKPETVKSQAKAESKPKAVAKKKVEKRDDQRAYKIVAFPLITEKATDLAAFNKYIFIVPTTANKSEIKKTITNIYGVTPVKINIINKIGKNVRYGRSFGKTKDFKKAIITLAAGEKIEAYEGV